MNRQNVTNIFITNLSISDLLVIGFALPSRVNLKNKIILNSCNRTKLCVILVDRPWTRLVNFGSGEICYAKVFGWFIIHRWWYLASPWPPWPWRGEFSFKLFGYYTDLAMLVDWHFCVWVNILFSCICLDILNILV